MTERRLFPDPPEIEPDREGSEFRRDVETAREPADAPGLERAAFLASETSDRIWSRLQLSAARERRRRKLRLAAAVATGAVAAAILVVVAWPGDPPGVVGHLPYQGGVAIKGSSALTVFFKRGATQGVVADGAALRPGDRLRFAYRSTRRYLMVVSIEERGAVNPFYPHPAGSSVAVREGGRATLPGSIELDDSVGAERVVALFSDRPLHFDDVRRALERAYPLRGGRRDLSEARPVDLGGEVASIRFRKQSGGAR